MAGAEGVPMITEFFLDPARTSLVSAELRQDLPKPGVHARGAWTKAESGKIRAGIPGGARVQKQFDTMLVELGFSMEGGRWPLEHPSASVCANFLALQAEIAGYLEDKRKGAASAQAAPPVRATPVAAPGGKRKGEWDGAAAGTPRSSKRTKG